MATIGQSQEFRPDSSTNEPAAQPEISESPGKRYNIPWGSGGLNLSAGLQGRYVDNVFLTHTQLRDDFVLSPELNFAAFFPIGRSNAVVVDFGLAYYEYLKNTSLNTGTPLINPNSELALDLKTGDFIFRFSEAFSYQESPVYETGGEFFNVYNTGRFARYDNRLGGSATWDLHDLVVKAAYYHEDLLANGSFYNYINHASELSSAEAMFALTPTFKAGVEAAGSLNRFIHATTNDTWRAKVGPALRWDMSQFIKVRLGAGYERIDYDSSEASALGIRPENTYYAYAGVDHVINRFFIHSVQVSHDNQLGYNAGNLEGTQVSYSLTWRPQESTSVSPHVAAIWYNESFGSGPPGLYSERFTYVLAGISAHYQLLEHWRTSLSWDYRRKDSEITSAGYAQNQVALELIYQF